MFLTNAHTPQIPASRPSNLLSARAHLYWAWPESTQEFTPGKPSLLCPLSMPWNWHVQARAEDGEGCWTFPPRNSQLSSEGHP